MHNQPMFVNVYSLTSRTTGFFFRDTGERGILQDGLLPHGKLGIPKYVEIDHRHRHHHHHHDVINLKCGKMETCYV